MAKKRRAFPVQNSPAPRGGRVPDSVVIDADEPSFGIFGYFRNPGVRETIESIIIAILLAFMFKTYEAEAFVIPTGSMAPSLQGEHMDLDCEHCGYRYLVGASQQKVAGFMDETLCPICNYRTVMNGQEGGSYKKGNAGRSKSNPEHFSNSGDRILVNKFIYDFHEPERFDVIVFKYPNNGKQNYIKRLIGLPGENILIENGDIYVMNENGSGGWDKEIARKPSKKVKQVLIDVDDTNFIGPKLKEVNWPSRWQQWDGGTAWKRNATEDTFLIEPSDSEQWLRYRHLVPTQWYVILNGTCPPKFAGKMDELPAGRLIDDSMSYNNGKYRRRDHATGFGQHWVGDLGVHVFGDITSSTGELLVDVVEGGAHFTCSIDVATGTATLRCADPAVEFVNESGTVVEAPVAETSLGTGSNDVLMVNADDQIHLWVNGSLASFDASNFRRSGMPMPSYSPEDPGDAEPVGVGGRNLGMMVTRLKVVRDIYYSSVKGDEAGWNESGIRPTEIHEIMNSPEQWSSEKGTAYFEMKRKHTEPMFSLEFGEGDNRDKDQFFPMGDNSTQSLDARLWPGPNRFVERDMLIGRAIYVYWPHTLNKPIPFFPNFGKMKFIR